MGGTFRELDQEETVDVATSTGNHDNDGQTARRYYETRVEIDEIRGDRSK